MRLTMVKHHFYTETVVMEYGVFNSKNFQQGFEVVVTIYAAEGGLSYGVQDFYVPDFPAVESSCLIGNSLKEPRFKTFNDFLLKLDMFLGLK